MKPVLPRLCETVRAIGRAVLTRDGLNFIAMAASIGGSAVLTALLGYGLHSLVLAMQWGAVANLAYGLLATIALVLLSLGFVISQRSFEAEFWKIKFKAATGDDDDDGGAS